MDAEATAYARLGDILAQSPDTEPDDAALHARLDKLSSSLRTQDALQDKPDPVAGAAGMGNAMGAGFRVVTELVAGILVGGGLGWLLDRWLHTKPLMMIVLGLLGVVGGFWNIIRTAMLPQGGRAPGSGKD